MMQGIKQDKQANRSDLPVQENRVSLAQQTVFPCQRYAHPIQITAHRFIDTIPPIMELLDSLVKLVHGVMLKITKKEPIHGLISLFLFLQIGSHHKGGQKDRCQTRKGQKQVWDQKTLVFGQDAHVGLSNK